MQTHSHKKMFALCRWIISVHFAGDSQINLFRINDDWPTEMRGSKMNRSRWTRYSWYLPEANDLCSFIRNYTMQTTHLACTLLRADCKPWLAAVLSFADVVNYFFGPRAPWSMNSRYTWNQGNSMAQNEVKFIVRK